MEVFLVLSTLFVATFAHPGIVYQQAQEEDAQDHYYQAQAGHDLQGYGVGQEHQLAQLQGKGYDLEEDHPIDYYVSGFFSISSSSKNN